MTNTELMNLKAALEAKRQELTAQLRGRVEELTIEDSEPELLDRLQRMSDRNEAAGILHRFSVTLFDVERSLRAIDQGRYGQCVQCDRAIPLKRLESIPWAPYCVRCQERFEAASADGSGPDSDGLEAA